MINRELRSLVVGMVATYFIHAPTAKAADDLTQPIHVSPDGHFLAQPDGKPFFWLGDTGWAMFMRLSREETDAYLKDRADKGFTVIQAVAMGGPLDLLDVPNRYGALPLIDKDPTRPNPKYFEHIDWVVDRAAHYGLRIAMLPVWGLSQISFGELFDPRTAEIYGHWIAERYRNKGVIWVLGGDTTPLWSNAKHVKDGQGNWNREGDVTVVDYRPIYDAMARGVIAGDGGNPFITYHPTGLSFSGIAHPRTSLYFHDRGWLDMNMLQSSHFIDASVHLKNLGADFSWDATYNYEPISEEYYSLPVRPVVDGEARFEDLAIDLDENAAKGYWTGYDTRNAAYHAVLAGAAGHTYGNHSVWQFYDPAVAQMYQLPKRDMPWQQAIDRPVTGQMQYLKTLMLSRPYFTRIPDQSLIVGEQGGGAGHIGATRSKDGSYAMIYLPFGQSVTVDLNKIAGLRAVAWWFDPRTGAATRIAGSFATPGATTFTPPTSGSEGDWVLVLDNESESFGAPGAKR